MFGELNIDPVCTQMLLIWLLLIPSAVASFDCRGTCNLCDVMNKNAATAACTLCSECMKSQNRRRLKLNKQKLTLTDHHEKQLKDLEKMKFKQVMREYGLKPKDFIDSDNSKEDVEDSSYDPEDCVNSSECVGAISEDNSGKHLLRYTTASIQDSTTATPKGCPPIKHCKKTLNKIINNDKPETSSTLPSFLKESIMRNMVTLNLDYEVDDHGCPTQPICSDDEDYASPVTKRGSLPLTTTSLTTAKICRQKLLLKRKIKTTPKPTPCVPCMPYCALPCGLQKIPPFLTASIPQAALEALITLKSVTDKPNADTTKKTEVATKETEGVTEETTKEFMYFYVGIPKDGKNLGNG